jgi:hypothetical protein
MKKVTVFHILSFILKTMCNSLKFQYSEICCLTNLISRPVSDHSEVTPLGTVLTPDVQTFKRNACVNQNTSALHAVQRNHSRTNWIPKDKIAEVTIMTKQQHRGKQPWWTCGTRCSSRASDSSTTLTRHLSQRASQGQGKSSKSRIQCGNNPRLKSGESKGVKGRFPCRRCVPPQLQSQP